MELTAVQQIVLLLVVAAVFLTGEILTPFFGMSAVSLVCAIAAVGIAFREGEAAGWATVGASVGLGFAALYAYTVWLPRTALGRKLMPPPPEAGVGDAFANLEAIEALAGRTGRAVSILRPVGAVEFDGRRFDCQAESGFIEAGTTVRVVAVNGTRVVVRPA
jgi:membrane-bound serine protease (ClpP class)